METTLPLLTLPWKNPGDHGQDPKNHSGENAESYNQNGTRRWGWGRPSLSSVRMHVRMSWPSPGIWRQQGTIRKLQTGRLWR